MGGAGIAVAQTTPPAQPDVVKAASVAPKPGPTRYFTGKVTVAELVKPTPPGRAGSGIVAFEAGARSNWHTHPAGQTLYVADLAESRSLLGSQPVEVGDLVGSGVETAGAEEERFSCGRDASAHDHPIRLPIQVVQFLDRHAAVRSCRGRRHGRSRWLCFPDLDPTRELAAVMRGHAVSIGAIGPDERVLGGTVRPGAPITAVSARLGIGFARARRMLVADGSAGRGLRRGVAAVVDPARVGRIERRMGSVLTGKGAAELLGVSGRIVRELASAGVVGRTDEGYDRVGILALAGRLGSGASPPGAIARLTDQARAGAGMARLCRAVLDGRVRAKLAIPGSSSLADVYVETGAVDARRVSKRLTVRGLAHELSIHEDAVRQLIPLGVLSDTASPTPTAAGLAFFRMDFVTAAELAGAVGMDAPTVRTTLKRLGIERAFEPDACRQVFFRRKEAEDALRDAVRRGTTDWSHQGAVANCSIPRRIGSATVANLESRMQ